MDSIVFLPTLDLERTRQFYTETLGLDLVLDQGTCLILKAGGGFWGFCASENGHSEPSKTILTLVTDDVDAWHARLIAAGVVCDGEPRLNQRFQIYHFYAEEPNGYRLEVQRFEDPRWSNSSQ